MRVGKTAEHMPQLSNEGFKAGTKVIWVFSKASSSSSNFLPVLLNFKKNKKNSQKELMGKCLHRELNDGVL